MANVDNWQKIPRMGIYQWAMCTGYVKQALLSLLVLIAVVFKVVPLEMQRRIVNDALGQQNVNLLFTYFQKYPSGKIVSLLVGEMETLGDFTGPALAIPLSSFCLMVILSGYLLCKARWMH